MDKAHLRSERAISPIIATLLLILIAIAAGVVVYAYVIGFVGNSTGNNGTSIDTLSIDQLYLSSKATSFPVTAYVRNQGPTTENFNTGFYVKSATLNSQLAPAVLVTGSGSTDTITRVQLAIVSSVFTVEVSVTCGATSDTITASLLGVSATSSACGSTTAQVINIQPTLPSGITISSITADSGSFTGVNVGSAGINSGKGDVVGMTISAGSITVSINSVAQLTLAPQGSQGTSSPLNSGITYSVQITGSDGATVSLSAKSA